MMQLIEIKDLHVCIKNKAILSGIDFVLAEGKITSIIGPNGSGKTTLLKSICRIVKPSRGSIALKGVDINKIKTKAFAGDVAFMTQHHECPSDLTVRELVEYGRYARRTWWKGGGREDQEIVDWALAKTGMECFAHRMLVTLSGGERQRAWIAMSLAQKPKLLILDEPTTYLDICHQLEILELIKALNRDEGITVLMVIHDINQAVRFSDELLIIREGKIYASGHACEIINEENLKEVFRVNTHIFYDSETKKPFFYPKNVFGG
ncbi:MAG: ABC transporter ATP-binding protein [Clostridia bacterium]|nr:ABC transporter ATP-binding protein [Clostridia bacterium]